MNRIVKLTLLAGSTLITCMLLAQEEIINEAQVRAAMHLEFCERLQQKFESGTRQDYLSEQAYDLIIEEMRSAKKAGMPVNEFLRQMWPRPANDARHDEFYKLAEFFVTGMSLEIISSLTLEIDQVQGWIDGLGRLQSIMRQHPVPDRKILQKLAKAERFSPRFLRHLLRPNLNWHLPQPDLSTFAAFALLKEEMSGIAPDPDIQLIFTWGEKYRVGYPFISQFSLRYSELFQQFRSELDKFRALALNTAS